MGTVRLLAFVGAVALAYHWWSDRADSRSLAQASPNGFIPVVMPDGAPRGTVIILAPLNCPSDAAQRADALSATLSRAGIPNLRSASYNSEIAEPTAEQQAGLERAVAVLNGEIPAVFVNGMGRANPAARDVIAEYQRTR